MTTAKMNRRDRRWLVRCAQAIVRELHRRNQLPDLVLKTPSSVVTEVSETGGWYADLGYVRGDRNSGLQVWFDRWCTPNTRKLYACYKGTRIEQIRNVAAAGSRLFGASIRLDDRAWLDDKKHGYVHLIKPLSSSSYGKPIVELYEKNQSWSFYGFYFRQTPKTIRRPQSATVRRVARFLGDVAKAVISQMSSPGDGKDYAVIENRQKVVAHLKRERSTLLAAKAKLQDSYTCQVCDLNFEEVYGRIGRGFAEAHHRLALSKLRPNVETKLSDLSTVCSNCHRMLHRMKGTTTDVATLRRAVRARR
jgi:hypothetical protein